MAHKAIQEDRGDRPSEDVTEEQFLKDLYLFMKKRDTPIERIPHLGFRQIDMYLMYKTVKELGGYHQVTAQQLWKQVYNTLGGNPRSTSAATCTRRHYEKLMLPYECHIKGLRLSSVQQPRNYHYVGHKRLEEDGPSPAKRRPELFLLQVYFPYLICTPSMPHSLECPPPVPNSTDRPEDPLEHLRYLAKQYESSAGLSEPLNLSVKASERDITTNPVSSFAPPSSNKNPKFLNKPSPLYTSQGSNVKSDAEGDVAAPSSFSSLKDSSSPNSQAVIIDADQHNKDTTEQNPDTMNKSKSPTGENRGRMEIEIPLSVFNNWLKLYGPQATLHHSRQLLMREDNKTKSPVAETVAANLTFEVKQSKLDEGISQHMPSQTSTNERYPPDQYHPNNYNPAFGALKNAASRDVYQLNGAKKPCNFKSVPTVCRDLTSSSGQTIPGQVSIVTDPNVPQDFRVSKPYVAEDHVQLMPESEVLQLNAHTALQLTPEEVMKLKRIISNSA
uniref:ARID domain-containing protein n=1 Tax=Neogobius melanostomus TaxID=47308 RepID=A0A8C6UDU4_9GOBI